MRIDGHRLDSLSPGPRCLGQPDGHVIGIAVPDDVEEPAVGHVHDAGDVQGAVLSVGAEHLVPVDPEGSDAIEAGRIVHQGLTMATDAVLRTLPAYPELPGHRRAVLADLATDLCGRPPGQESSTSSLASVKDFCAQSGSLQIHFRFLHTRRTGRPPEGRPRIWMTERPCPVARTPQFPHPTMSAVGSTEMNTSPSSSVIARTTNPSIPNSAVAPLLPSFMSRAPPVSLVW